ncbi:MAG: LamG domain-containing protein [Sandaracinaceae bacterium]|nr:LamG domain-containing protein [Sandaracinaceae bacterium]
MPRRVLTLVLGGTLFAGCYLSHPGESTPFDGGARPDVPITPLFDGDFPGFDAGPTRRDAGRFDAGTPDGGLPGFDAGRDAGFFFDGGFVGFDAGRPRRDAGVRLDAGPRDAGPGRDASRPDAGPGLDAGGPRRPALRFTATTYFEVEDSPAFDTPDDSALEMWVRSREPGDATFCEKGDATTRHLFVGVRGGNLVMGWEVAPLSHTLVGPPLVLDRWTHVAFVAQLQPDGRHTTYLYVDGVAVARMADVPELRRAFGDQVFTCGRSDVDIDEIRVWRVARDQMAIIANMNMRISGSIPGMVAYWRLDERGQIALDYTASGKVAILGALTTADPADPMWIGDGPF